MKYYNKLILLFIMIFILITMNIGCTGSNPIIPEVNPNPTVNPDNSIVIDVKVTPSFSTIKIDESLQLLVKGYNSDDEWVVIDKSKIKLWDWSVENQCYNCVVDKVNLSPKSGSLTTTFTSGVNGTFYVVAYYQENAGGGYITDYVQIIVTK